MFKEIPVKNPHKNRCPVFGVGINDASYKTQLKIDGKRCECPFYTKWQGMLKRAYYQPYKDKNKTYKDCTVCTEWLLFSRFKLWMIKQDWQGKHLDKDLLVQGNKQYAPNLCLFLDPEINQLVSSCAKTKGNYKAGVVARNDNKTNSFAASCSNNGKQVHLGYFDNVDDAHKVYLKHKYKIIAKAAMRQQEPIRSALLRYKVIT